MRNVLLSILFIILPTLANAQETIVSYDKSSLSVLNEELRQSASGIRTLRGQIADLLPIDLSSSGHVSNILTVPNGGTGISSLTAYGVLVGGTSSTGSMQSVSPGTTGQLLTSNGSNAVPSFQTLTLPTQYLQLVSTTTIDDAKTSGNISIDTSKNYLAYIYCYAVGSNDYFYIAGIQTALGAKLFAILFISKTIPGIDTRAFLVYSNIPGSFTHNMVTNSSTFAVTNGFYDFDGEIKLYEVVQ